VKGLIKKPKGTQDVLLGEVHKWQFLEKILKSQAENYNFSEIRTPIFEYTELFNRSVGEATDIIQKEMYTFEDKGERLITLRPEGTAGKVRAFFENAVYNKNLPVKFYYFDKCYRYEKPQAGRYREFTQFGVEIFGASSILADAELISFACEIFKKLNIKNVNLEINTIGCSKCREKYFKELKKYLKDKKENLCVNCVDRIEKNIMRVLDCKNLMCKESVINAPKILDFICQDCKKNFEDLKLNLDNLNIEYKVNLNIVRGLDYYNGTVFEFIYNEIGAQSQVCGGGRYDKLTENLGGKLIPALGFGIGLERLLLVMENQGLLKDLKENSCEIYIASADEISRSFVMRFVSFLRENNINAECDLVNRSLKAQLKYADKINCEFVIVIGEEELKNLFIIIKSMRMKKNLKVSLKDKKEFLKSFLNFKKEVYL